jgi:hypothetical protein
MSADIVRPYGFIAFCAYYGRLVPQVVINPCEVKSIERAWQNSENIMTIVTMNNDMVLRVWSMSFEDVVQMVNSAMRERLRAMESTCSET